MLTFRSINILGATALVLLLITGYFIALPVIYYVWLIGVWLIITILGSTQIGLNYHFKSWNSNRTIRENQVAISFDDGPNPNFTPQVLSLLKRFNAKATFFCIGKNAESHPLLVKEIIDQGHTIGNHTYTHSNSFGFLSTEKVISELEKTNEIIYSLTRLKLRLYRPAFGITNPRIKKAMKHTGLISIGWSIRSLDTIIYSQKKILKRVTRRLKKGDIILLHDSSARTVAVLEHLLIFLQANNLQPVTVDKLLYIKPYE
jgi:peptidoglycan/xylan/chitin deacetylase (PgdA/CDA1 family)